MKKRAISILLMTLLVLSLIPATAFAEGENVGNQGQKPAEPVTTEAVEPAGSSVPKVCGTSSNLSTLPGAGYAWAMFELADYSVLYDGNGADGGTVPDDSGTYYHTDPVTVKPGLPTKTGYDFAGWQIGGSGIVYHAGDSFYMPAEKVTLVAKWEKHLYTVTYDAGAVGHLNAGTAASEQVLYEEYPAAVPEETHDNTALVPGMTLPPGYKFLGWSSDGGITLLSTADVKAARITANTAYVAHFEHIGNLTLTVQIKTNGVVSSDGGTVTSSLGTSIAYPQATQVTQSANPGYHFVKWTADGTNTAWGSIWVRMTEDKTVIAEFAGNSYTVAYDSNGGTGTAMGSTSHIYGVEQNLPANTYAKTGYTFAGWATAADGAVVYADGASAINLAAADGAAVTLYAVWAANSYTVQYDGNGGDGGATADSNHVYGVSSALTANGFTRAGYTFAGWATAADGAVVYADGASAINLAAADGATVTLYAKWTIRTYTVRFFDYTGTVQIGATQTIGWGVAAALETAPAREGRAFDEWVLTGDDNTVATSLANVRENIDAAASYILKSYTVTFVDHDGSVTGTDDVLYGGAAAAPAVPGREGYTFIGWDASFGFVTADMTVTALYRINTYTVTFVNYDGAVLDAQTVNWNTAATAPTVPDREGYTFSGWDADFSAVRADMTVTARFTQNETVKDEPIPGTSDDSAATLQEEPVPQQGPAAFPWWWIVIGVGAAVLLFLLVFLLAKRERGQNA